jgi:hypothetical protein
MREPAPLATMLAMVLMMTSCAGHHRERDGVADQRADLDAVVVTDSLVRRKETLAPEPHPGFSAPMPMAGACDGPLKNDQCAETFIVFYDLHHGYKLARQDDVDRFVMPEFATEDVQAAISRFVWQDNPTHAGKRVLCECVGKWFERDGSAHFLILEATMRVGDRW